jgi:hypothetical protein
MDEERNVRGGVSMVGVVSLESCYHGRCRREGAPTLEFGS